MITIVHSIMALAILSLAACSSSPTASKTHSEMEVGTKTGTVKNIVITDTVTPNTLTAHAGDEIRWINRQQGDARVIFLLPMEGQLSCQRGFGGLMSANKNQYTAKLRVNDTASVCFKHPSEIKYVVRGNSNLSNDEDNIAGTINIGGRQGSSNEDGEKRAQSSQ